MSPNNRNHQPDNYASGVAYALGGFILWGLAPIYFKELAHVAALELLSYRMVFSFIFLIFLLFFRRSLAQVMREIKQALSNVKILSLLLVSALLITTNWLVYIWAVAHNHVVETSLGYFINPLMNVGLGMLVLGERLSRTKLMAVGLAAVGVIYMVIAGGEFPWIALFLATTFAFYGLIRKKVLIGAIIGLWVEMLILLPGAVGYMIYLAKINPETTGEFDTYTMVMLVMSGVVTTVPLMLFAAGASRLPLSTIGIIQYVAPTMSLVMAVFLWDEPFTMTHMIAFGCIWSALAIYTMNSFFPGREKVKASG